MLPGRAARSGPFTASSARTSASKPTQTRITSHNPASSALLFIQRAPRSMTCSSRAGFTSLASVVNPFRTR